MTTNFLDIHRARGEADHPNILAISSRGRMHGANLGSRIEIATLAVNPFICDANLATYDSVTNDGEA